MPDQVPFGTNSFADNPEPRCPCILLLDVSGSMNGQPITQLNMGVQTFKDAIIADSLAAKRVETAVILFGDTVQVANEFCTVDAFNPAPFTAGGNTPMGAAIVQAIDMVKRRKDEYKANGIGYRGHHSRRRRDHRGGDARAVGAVGLADLAASA